MSAKHTPGPWSLEPVKDRSIEHLVPVDGNQMSILTVVEVDGVKFAAVYLDEDARLIVAAPDLLDALRICEGNITSLADSHPRVWAGWLSVVQSAIAKATGESK